MNDLPVRRGSSPHGWGKLPHVRPRRRGPGIIPTRVGKASTPSATGGARRDHPHTGGESYATIAGMSAAQGSSPHGWGKPGRRRRARRSRGIIPTRVGKATGSTTRSDARRDHPHTGGESALVPGATLACTGSSPHGWGKLLRDRLPLRPPGIIPTRVGKAASAATRRPTSSDHPHTGGESTERRSAHHAAHGSSPHGWGKPRARGLGTGSPRIIPTRVGKAEAHDGGVLALPDHPHTGGESAVGVRARRLDQGSSPHGWGKLHRPAPPRDPPGIIPTRVGKAWTGDEPASSVRDHPHTGGESSSWCGSSRSIRLARGSSPHGWGKLAVRVLRGRDAGIIPTRVGKAWARSRRPSRTADHPHTGGESSAHAVVLREGPGSSPHGWGKQVLLPVDRVGHRIIPTRVGKARRRPEPSGRSRDHPHTGGESLFVPSETSSSPGSSPHGWGKQARLVAEVGQGGIIPTRVGKAPGPSARKWPTTDHPHTGGESGAATGAGGGVGGSSPHGWGKLVEGAGVLDAPGIIPTRVGKATRTSSSWARPRDHPHTGGESIAAAL